MKSSTYDDSSGMPATPEKALCGSVSAKTRDGTDGWLEAAIAWEVCASIHEKYAKGKDALYKTRHADFVAHAKEARRRAIKCRDAR
jgi:hypothetical protein